MFIYLIKKHFSDSLHKNAFYLMVNSVIGGVLGFIFWIIVARYYSTSDVGLASAIISAASLLAMFSNLGFNMSIVRFLATSKSESENLINSTFTLGGVSSILLSLFYIYNVEIISPSLISLKLNAVYAMSFVLLTFSIVIVTIQDHIFIAMRCAEYVLIKNLILGTKVLFPILFIVLGAYGIFTSFFISYFLSLILGLFIMIPKIIHNYKPNFSIKQKIINKIFHFSVGNYVSTVFDNVLGLVLPIIIINLISNEDSAYFYVTWMIASLLYTVPKSITMSLFSECSLDKIRLKEDIYKCVDSVILFITPTILFFFIFGDKLLLLFGKDYSANSLLLLELFVVSAIPLSINQIYFTIKRIEKEMNTVVKMNALISIGTLGISYYYLPKNGLIVIGLAWLLTQSAVTILSLKDILELYGGGKNVIHC